MTSSETDTELLTTAVERGYFKVPRQTSLLELADAHDMSDVETSKRLRTEIDMVCRESLDRCDTTGLTEE